MARPRTTPRVAGTQQKRARGGELRPAADDLVLREELLYGLDLGWEEALEEDRSEDPVLRFGIFESVLDKGGQ